MVANLMFTDYDGRPQYENDLAIVVNLRSKLPDQVQTKDITQLAMLLIRYNYPPDLAEIAESWGFSLNALLAAARNAWERGEYVSSDTEMGGSGWDATSNN